MDLLGGSPAKPPVEAAASAVSQSPPTAAAFPPIIAYSHAATGVNVAFSFLKPPGNDALTEITARYLNNGTTGVVDFNLQVSSGGG